MMRQESKAADVNDSGRVEKDDGSRIKVVEQRVHACSVSVFAYDDANVAMTYLWNEATPSTRAI